MHRATLLALAALVSPAAGQDVYKWVGQDGRVEYTDRPVPGAERLPSTPPPPQRPPASAETPAEPGGYPGGQSGPYEAFEIAAPAPDATLHEAAGGVQVGLVLSPALFPGHRIQLLVDDLPVAGEVPGTQLLLRDLTPGTHNLRALILDDRERPVASTARISFHVPGGSSEAGSR
jgi:hypothetical protein